MELNLQPRAQACLVTGRPFVDGDRVASFLMRGVDGAISRCDVLEEHAARFAPPGFVICRWVQIFKHASREETPVGCSSSRPKIFSSPWPIRRPSWRRRTRASCSSSRSCSSAKDFCGRKAAPPTVSGRFTSTCARNSPMKCLRASSRRNFLPRSRNSSARSSGCQRRRQRRCLRRERKFRGRARAVRFVGRGLSPTCRA